MSNPKDPASPAYPNEEGAQPEEHTEMLDTGAMETYNTPPPMAEPPPYHHHEVDAASTYVEPPAVYSPDDPGLYGGDAGGSDGGDGSDAPPPSSDDDALNSHRMTLLEHLSELRLRLRNAGIAFLVAMIASFFFVKEFFEVLSRPVRLGMRRAGFDDALNIIDVTEPFWVFMKLAIVAGILIASPLVFWELWKFVAPGLYKKEKKMAGLLTCATAFCFVGGALFGYFVLTEPAAYYMFQLAGMKPGEIMGPAAMPLKIEQEVRIEDVANFMTLMLAGCGVAFELPVVLSVLGWMGIISAAGMRKFWKYAFVLSVVTGAVLTPSGDPISQMLLAGPLFILYILSIFIVMLIEKGRKKRESDLEAEYARQDLEDANK